MDERDPFRDLFNGLANILTAKFSVCMDGEFSRPRFMVGFPSIPPRGTIIMRPTDDPPTAYRVKEVLFFSPNGPGSYESVPDSIQHPYKLTLTTGILIVEELASSELALLTSP